MCSRSYVCCQVLKYVILTAVTIPCVVLLSFALYHKLVLGPRNTPLSLQINSCNIDTTEQKGNVTQFPLKWNAEFAVVNTKGYMEEIISFGAETLISYNGFLFSCGFVGKIQGIPAGEEKSFGVEYTPGRCQLTSDFRDSPVYESFVAAMKKGVMNVTVGLNMRAYYKHNRFWGWNVWINPRCRDLVIEYDNDVGNLEDDRPVQCYIPRPSKYI